MIATICSSEKRAFRIAPSELGARNECAKSLRQVNAKSLRSDAGAF
jgi:hypothetical protein